MELSAFKRNNFILNKLLPCLLITMFAIMCLYGSRVYASSSTLNFSNHRPLTLDSSVYDSSYFNNRYIYIFTHKDDSNRNSDWTTYLISSAQPLSVHKNNNANLSHIIVSSDMTDDSLYNENNPAIHLFSADSSNGFNFTLIRTQLTYNPNSDIVTVNTQSNFWSLYSNYDVYRYNVINTYTIDNSVEPTLIQTASNLYDSNENLVFQVPSQTQPTIVASQVGEVEMNKTLQEILGILPVVVVVLVGLIAIRKGIQFLIARMKKA